MNGESVFGWIKTIATLLLLALIGFLIWKLWSCVSSPLECLKNAFSTLGKFFQGTGKLGMPTGNALTSSTRPGQIKETSPSVVNSVEGAGGDEMGCDPREVAAYGDCVRNPNPLSILIIGAGGTE